MRLVLCLLLAAGAHGATVQQTLNDDLVVTANLVEIDGAEQGEPIFLVLHGTWAHAGMEIIRALQEGLAERGYASLAPTLSLGESNRTGFRDCSEPLLMRHGDAVRELELWVRFLKRRGHRNIVLVGHSRGAAQVALYLATQKESAVSRLVLIAPMVFRSDEAGIPKDSLLGCEGVEVAEAVVRSYHSDEPPKHTPWLLGRVATSAQVFLGSEDEVAPWTAEEQGEVAASGLHEVVVVEGADHLFRDLYLDDVLDLVVEGL